MCVHACACVVGDINNSTTSREDPQAITDDDSCSDNDFDPSSSKPKSRWNSTRRRSTRRTAVKFTKLEDDKLLCVASL